MAKIEKIPGLKNIPYDLDIAKAIGLAPWHNKIQDDFHVEVYTDDHPITKGHEVFVPTHAETDLIVDCFCDALQTGLRMVKEGICDGFNIGMNFGKAAGQNDPWPHIHLIPRKKGDCEDPSGGVRNIIPKNR